MAAAGSILSDVSSYVDRAAKLLRLDAELLGIETKNNLQSVAVSISLFVAAAVVALLGLVALVFAAVLVLIELGMQPWLSAVIVAVVLFVIAGSLVLIGSARLRTWTLTPRRTLNQFRANIEALRASLRDEPSTHS